MLVNYKGINPKIDKEAKVFESAVIIGDVTLERNVNVWYNATIRGDMAKVVIKENTNIQDNCVVHTNLDLPTFIGKNCTVGHGAIIHAATVGDNCLIGMGSIILDNAIINNNSLVAAGSVVTPNKEFPANSLILGNPAKVVKTLSDKDIEAINKNTEYYVNLMKEYE